MPSTLSTLDFLYLSLSAAVIVLAIVLTVLIIQATLALRDVRKITSVAGEVVEKFHGMVTKPIQLITKIVETVTPRIEEIVKKQVSRISKKKKG